MDAVPAEMESIIQDSTLLFHRNFLLTSNSDGDAEHNQAEDQEDDGPGASELGANTGHFPAFGQ